MTKTQINIFLLLTILLFISMLLIVSRELHAKQDKTDCLYFPKKITVDAMAKYIAQNTAIISDGADPLIINSRAIIVARSEGGYITHILLSPELGNLCYELKK